MKKRKNDCKNVPEGNKTLLKLVLLICVLELFLGGLYGRWKEYRFNLIRSNTVKIKVLDQDGEERQGTGIFIRDNLIITAGHMVDGAEVVDIILPNGDCYKGRSWYQEDIKIIDLGFIDVNTPQVEKAIRFVEGRTGDTVWALGNPFGAYPSLTKGIISNMAFEDQEYYFGTKLLILTDCPLNPGNSGSPLFSPKGIVGICVGRIPCANDFSFCVPARICRLSLQKYLAIKALENCDATSAR